MNHRSIRHGLFVLAGLALTLSCVSPQHPDDTTDPATEARLKELGFRCEGRATTGTRIKRKRCSTSEQRAAERRAAQDVLDRMKEDSRRQQNRRTVRGATGM